MPSRAVRGALLLSLAWPVSGAAQMTEGVRADAPASSPAPCLSQANTLEINACLSASLAMRDKALNAAYQDLLKRLVAADAGDTTDYPRARKHLLDAQRAWISFRDTDCAGRVILYEGGSIRGAVQLSCLIRHTEQRTQSLRDWTFAR
jgi:uncharacterized protein YecT (DUF1311 family)